ncbi:MAG: SGNH/GDSL hydrolase family protein [Eubacteriales bacterium]|nr:SGNH/GDSL hydrolase family protein [Eubacteriales bacterium]
MAIRVLFQGDSITDVGRSREVERMSGSGYPTLVAARLGYEAPGEYECLNRGISGNRVVDLYARWRIDALNLRPDIITILIGVNDVWHDVDERWNGVEAGRFEQVYDMLLQYTHEKAPDTRVIVLEPFVLHGTATDPHWEYFAAEVPLRAQAARRVAEKHGCTFVPLQADLDAACEKAPPAHWLIDGVHPTAAGHELIARKLYAAIRGE